MTVTIARTERPSKKLTPRRKMLIFGCSAISAVILLGLSQGTLVMNGSKSLPDNGYFMLRWPKLVSKGSYVAFETPEPFQGVFGDFVFVKKVFAVGGEVIEVHDDKVCVEQICFPISDSAANKGLKLNQATIVPEGRLAVYGTADDSLDSRYAQIGFLAKEDVIASGYPVPVPHWEKLQGWVRKWF